MEHKKIGGDIVIHVFFRCDASPTLGFGHLMRCRALAYALKHAGSRCIMIGPSLEYRLPGDFAVFDEWIPKNHWDSSLEDVTSLLSCIEDYSNQSVIVLDDYRVDESYQQKILEAGLRWLQFDSKADKPIWADWVLNASPAASQEKYAKLLQKPGAVALVGPRYAVLRPEFSLLTPRIYQKSESLNVLVTFGGGDDCGALLFSLRALFPVTSPEISFHIISGLHNPNNKEIMQWVRSKADGRIHLHINPLNVAPIFLDCDIAIMAGGTTTFEAAACGLPMILITIAENQVGQAQAWHDLGIAVFLGRYGIVSAGELIHEFSKLMDIKTRQKMGNLGMSTVNVKGADLIAMELLKSEEYAGN